MLKKLVLIFLCWLTQLLYSYEFVVIIPSYNNSQWWEQNLTSVLQQDTTGHQLAVIFIDDCSTDGTGLAVKNYLAQNPAPCSMQVILNQQRQGALANIYRAVHSCPDSAIILTVDGDDQLVGNQVLQILAQAYRAGSWLTYGQYLNYPARTLGSCRTFNPAMSLRMQPFCASHLRTFYAGLFKQIKLADLLDKQDQFYPMAWDLAFMLPMLEMCHTKYQFISRILYSYNRANVISDQQVNPNLQVTLAEQIKRKPPYRPIKSYQTASDEQLPRYLILDKHNFSEICDNQALQQVEYVVLAGDDAPAVSAVVQTNNQALEKTNLADHQPVTAPALTTAESSNPALEQTNTALLNSYCRYLKQTGLDILCPESDPTNLLVTPAGISPLNAPMPAYVTRYQQVALNQLGAGLATQTLVIASPLLQKLINSNRQEFDLTNWVEFRQQLQAKLHSLNHLVICT